MAYLLPAEYAVYGLGAETADAWVAAASAMMEAFCRRSSLVSASYTERLRMSRAWGSLQLTYGPVTAVTAVQARYLPYAGEYGEGGANGLLEYALTFGLPGQWVTVDPGTVTLDAVTGELRLPPNLMGLRYSEAEVTYTAGLATVPVAVKVACAQIVKNAQATPGLNVRSSKLDTLQTQYFSDSLLDTQVQAMLRPYVAVRVG